MAGVVTSLQHLKEGGWHVLSSHLTRWANPLMTSLPLSTLADLGRSKAELVAENALFLHQLIMLRREGKRPPITRIDHILLVLLVRLVPTWQQALLIVQPETGLALPSRALPPDLEAQVQGYFSQAEGRHPHDRASSGRWPERIGCGVLSACPHLCRHFLR